MSPFQRLINWMTGSSRGVTPLSGPAAPEVSVVVDLDELTRRHVGFRWKGIIYQIPPLEFETFLRVMNQCAVLDELRTSKKLSEEQLTTAYFQLFVQMQITPAIKRQDIKTMHHTQIAALFNLIVEVIMGKAQVDYEKKSLQAQSQQVSRPQAY